MRYTRYNIRKRRNISAYLIIILILVVAIGGGMLLSKIIFKGGDVTSSDNLKNNNGIINNNGNDNKSNHKGDATVISVVQCGYFASKDNALKTKESVDSAGGYCLVVEENKKYRDISYLGNSDEADKVLEALKEKKINAIKMNIYIPNNNEVDNQMGQIIVGLSNLVNASSNKDVKSIKTESFKKWTSELKKIDGESENNKELKDIKEYVSKLPNEITRNDMENFYGKINKYLFNYR